jgi:mycothiol synthase
MTEDLPSGYLLRRPVLADASSAAELVGAMELDIDNDRETTAADIAGEWHGLDLDRDVWLVEAAGGSLAAYVRLVPRGSEYWVDGYVHPCHRGQGLGAYLIRATEGEARARGHATAIQNAVSARDAPAIGLLESEGYELLLTFYRMAIRLPGEPTAPMPPQGVAIGVAPPESWRGFHAAKERAFAEDSTHEPETYEHWLARSLARDDHDHSLLFAAVEDGRVVGVAHCVHRHPGGFVRSLGVVPEARRRGIGEALLAYAFGEFWRRGVHEVRLGVHAANRTGATRLYERVGMRVLTAFRVYEKPLLERE